MNFLVQFRSIRKQDLRLVQRSRILRLLPSLCRGFATEVLQGDHAQELCLLVDPVQEVAIVESVTVMREVLDVALEVLFVVREEIVFAADVLKLNLTCVGRASVTIFDIDGVVIVLFSVAAVGDGDQLLLSQLLIEGHYANGVRSRAKWLL
jgi:hypothetical protein